MEGALRERFPVDNVLVDYQWFGILEREFRTRPEFEAENDRPPDATN
jgi:hypothetical protein